MPRHIRIFAWRNNLAHVLIMSFQGSATSRRTIKVKRVIKKCCLFIECLCGADFIVQSVVRFTADPGIASSNPSSAT